MYAVHNGVFARQEGGSATALVATFPIGVLPRGDFAKRLRVKKTGGASADNPFMTAIIVTLTVILVNGGP